MLRIAGSIVLGILVTTAFTFALITLGSPVLFGAEPNRWLLVGAMLAAGTVPFFLGSMLCAYVGQRSGWKLALGIYVPGSVILVAAFRSASFGDTAADVVLTFAMAFGLALLFSIYGGLFGQRILTHRRRARASAVAFDVDAKAIDTREQPGG